MKIKITREVVDDAHADLSYLTDASRYEGEAPEDIAKYQAQDAQRIQAYNRGHWGMVGIRAKAEIMVPSGINGGYITIVTIKSPGLWGIESDSDESYFAEEYRNQVDELKTIIEAIRGNVPEYSEA